MARHLSPIILSVQDDRLQALQVRPTEEGFVVRGYSDRPLHPGIVQGGEVIKREAFLRLFEDLLSNPQQGELDGRELALLLDDQAFVQRVVSVFQADELNPSLVDRLANAFFAGKQANYQTKTSPVEGGAYVQFVGLPKQTIGDFKKLFGSEEMSLDQLFSRSAGRLHAYFHDQHVAEPMIDVHVGDGSSELTLVDQYGIHLSLHVPVGVRRCIEETSRVLQVTPAKARDALFSVGLRRVKSGSPQYQNAIEQSLLELARAIGELKLFYRSQRRHDEPPVLHVSGEGLFIPQLAEYLSETSNLVLRPFMHSVPLRDELGLHDLLKIQPLLGGAMHGYRSSTQPYFSDSLRG